MQRAEKLFSLEERQVDSAFVSRVWRTTSVASSAFISVSATHWEIVVWRQAGRTQVTMRGPETRATPMPIPADAEFFGIEFKLGAFMPEVSPVMLVDRGLEICTGTTLRLGGVDREIPTYDNVDVFLGRLARENLVSWDPIAAEAMAHRPTALSRRSIERRILRSTGLTLGAIARIDRAHRAAALLERGAAISDVVSVAGYADQAHLTRSLKRFIGQTPGAIARDAG
jgi:hypothetical protein